VQDHVYLSFAEPRSAQRS